MHNHDGVFDLSELLAELQKEKRYIDRAICALESLVRARGRRLDDGLPARSAKLCDVNANSASALCRFFKSPRSVFHVHRNRGRRSSRGQ